ncbi:MAG: amidinotransferase [Flavobacteriaceae bacterium]|nr:amidinotransferase [Flavobacteriaceae bacterium]
MKLFINDETSRLKSVLLGNAKNIEKIPTIHQTYDPSSIINLKRGTYPEKSDLVKELKSYKKSLELNGVDVYELDNVPNCNQIFARDIGFVIEDYFFISNILPLRIKEINGLNSIIKKIDNSKIIKLDSNIHIEGGDIILDNDYIFIGYYNKDDYERHITARTNLNAVKFLQEKFSNKKIKAFELRKSITDPSRNALHLDCCFQPLGDSLAVISKGGFANLKDYEWLINYYGEENVLNLNNKEMSLMMCNILSISKNEVISDIRFTKLNTWLKSKKIKTIEINLKETSKQGGLFRCATLPLERLNEFN